MPPKIELDKFRDVDDIVTDSVEFFKQNFKPLLTSYFTINGFFIMASIIVSVLNYYKMRVNLDEGTPVFGITYFLALFVNMLTIMASTLTVLSYIAIYKEKNKEAPEVAEVWGYVKYYFLRTLGATIVITIGVIIGTIFCIIPGIYLFTVFSIIYPIIVMENATFNHALDRCFKLIRNNWWSVFGSMIIVTLIVIAGFIILYIPVGLILEIYALMTGVSIITLYQLPVTILGQLFNFLYILPLIALALNYYSLIEQTDNTTLIARIENFGIAKNDTEETTDEEY